MMRLLARAFDGFPIYDLKNPDGSDIAVDALDVCNGQVDDTFGYRYHTSEDAPYIIQCLMGEVSNLRHLPRVSPLRSAHGGHKSAGRPPREGVKNLVFQKTPDGAQRMDYTYKGAHYYIQYRLTEQDNCYLFESKTITDNGAVQSGVYCR